jgi:serine/threonine protein kinase
MKLPAQIGKYEIVDLIGYGGMGVVYKACDTVLGRLVALKVMTSSLADSAEVRERFLREARAVSVLQHPNIVVVHELGDRDGSPYIVMEYLDGDPLEHTIRTHVTLTVLEKIDIILQVAKALQYAHEKGVVHRDVKPGNIMLMRDGGVKVVDFGIAHLADQTIPRTGLVLGTVSYMSPEQLNGQPVDARTDVFSLGIVFYLLLTGKLPFEGASTAETMMKILLEPPPALSRFGSVNPPELQPIVDKALAKEKEGRYQGCAEMASDLLRLRNAARPSNLPPTRILLQPPSKQFVWTASTVVMLLAATLIGVAVYRNLRIRSTAAAVTSSAPIGSHSASSDGPPLVPVPIVTLPSHQTPSRPPPASTPPLSRSRSKPLSAGTSTAGESPLGAKLDTKPENAEQLTHPLSAPSPPSITGGNDRFQVMCDCGGNRYHNGVMTVSSGIIRYELLEAADSQLSFVVSASEIKNIRLPSG